MQLTESSFIDMRGISPTVSRIVTRYSASFAEIEARGTPGLGHHIDLRTGPHTLGTLFPPIPCRLACALLQTSGEPHCPVTSFTPQSLDRIEGGGIPGRAEAEE
jgi:hypothetical protein